MSDTRTDATSFLYELAARADAAPDSQRSLFYLVMQLVTKIETMSGDVASLGDEANAFSDVKSDLTNIKKDIDNMKKWVADWRAAHGGKDPTSADAMASDDYKANVKQFKADMLQYDKDTKSYSKYSDKGMDEAIDNNSFMNGTTFNVPGKGQMTLDQLVNEASSGDLGIALFDSAKAPDGTGTFDNWANRGGAIDPKDPSKRAKGINDVSTDFGTYIGSLDQKLSTFGNYLQQVDQSGQNMITSTTTGVNVMVQNQKTG